MSNRILRRLATVELPSPARYRPVFAAALLALIVWSGGAPAEAREGSRTHLSGTFNDYVWVESGGGAGAWHVTGGWTVKLDGQSGRAEFLGSLLGVRSDLWVLQTNTDPANPALRSPHTHHVGLLHASVTEIPNGVRLTGNALITANGAVAPYSGAPIQVDITGGGLLRFSNIKLTFLGTAIDHFGPQPYDGVVHVER